MSNREKSVLSYMLKAGRGVTTKELLDSLPQMKRDSIRRALNALVEKSLVVKSGASVSTIYELNSKPCVQSVSPAIQTFMRLSGMNKSC